MDPRLTWHRRLRGRLTPPALLGLAVLAAVAAVSAVALARRSAAEPADPAGPPLPLYPVVVRRPAGPPAVRTGEVDASGRPITVSCGVCHTTRPPNLATTAGGQLAEFHQGLKVAHGGLTCVSCHNPAEGYTALRLADGRSLAYADVMQMCAQCHGTAYRDYQHGSHGGMTGHWDRTRGGRVRNNCIDCHDPHSPKYPVVRPAPGPRDRFLDVHRDGSRHE